MIARLNICIFFCLTCFSTDLYGTPCETLKTLKQIDRVMHSLYTSDELTIAQLWVRRMRQYVRWQKNNATLHFDELKSPEFLPLLRVLHHRLSLLPYNQDTIFHRHRKTILSLLNKNIENSQITYTEALNLSLHGMVATDPTLELGKLTKYGNISQLIQRLDEYSSEKTVLNDRLQDGTSIQSFFFKEPYENFWLIMPIPYAPSIYNFNKLAPLPVLLFSMIENPLFAHNNTINIVDFFLHDLFHADISYHLHIKLTNWNPDDMLTNVQLILRNLEFEQFRQILLTSISHTKQSSIEQHYFNLIHEEGIPSTPELIKEWAGSYSFDLDRITKEKNYTQDCINYSTSYRWIYHVASIFQKYDSILTESATH